MKAYEILVDSQIEPEAKVGTLCYELKGIDFGAAEHDSHVLGVECVAVSLKESGDYPFFCIPAAHLKELK